MINHPNTPTWNMVVGVGVGVGVEEDNVEVISLAWEIDEEELCVEDVEGVVERLPTVIVLVDDEVCERVREGAIGMDEVADGNGELNDPDIPERLKETI